MALFAIADAATGEGVFALGGSPRNLLSLQLFLVVVSIPILFLAVVTEERRQIQRALVKNQASLRDLSGHLIHAHEEERIRIARELHDDVSQRMALLQSGLDQIKEDVAGFSSQGRQQLDHITEMAAEVSSSIHDLSHQLHPSKLEILGLVSSVKRLCREFSEQHHMQVQLVHRDLPAALPKDVALSFYRIVQESLRNVVRHSGVAEAKVELTGAGDRVELCVSDRGVGFDPASPDGATGLGLISMRERLRVIRGRLVIESEISGGTRIRAYVPLSGANSEVTGEEKGS
jgi:signal transduction histidine kinase